MRDTLLVLGWLLAMVYLLFWMNLLQEGGLAGILIVVLLTYRVFRIYRSSVERSNAQRRVEEKHRQQRIEGAVGLMPCPDQQHVMPAHVEVYKQTREYDELSVPKPFLSRHNTRKGVWGRLCVISGPGSVAFTSFASDGAGEGEVAPQREQVLMVKSGYYVVIPPCAPHKVRFEGDATFCLQFLRAPSTTSDPPTATHRKED